MWIDFPQQQVCDSLIITNHQKIVSIEMIFANLLKYNDFANINVREKRNL